jgi:hypothetical protein
VALGHEIRELVEAASDEIDELHFRDGTQPQVAHAAGRADDSALADGRVDHAFPAESLEQAFAGFERAPIDTHVFADEHDCRVSSHLFEHGLADCFKKRDRRHG